MLATMRAMLAAHPLQRTWSQPNSSRFFPSFNSYTRPNVKILETPAFLLMGNWRLRIEHNGRANIMKSDPIFHDAVSIECASGLRQWPGILGFQTFARGLQANTSQKKTKTYTTRLLHIRAWMARYVKPLFEGTKILKY